MPVCCLQICPVWTGLLYWALSLLWYCSSVQWHSWLWWPTGKVFLMWILCFLADTFNLSCSSSCVKRIVSSISSLLSLLYSKSSSQGKEEKVSSFLVLISLSNSKWSLCLSIQNNFVFLKYKRVRFTISTVTAMTHEQHLEAALTANIFLKLAT